MTDRTMGIVVGSRVVVRPHGAAEVARYLKRHLVGTVVAAEDLPAYGYGIKIQWPDEEPPYSFEHASLYQLATPVDEEASSHTDED